MSHCHDSTANGQESLGEGQEVLSAQIDETISGLPDIGFEAGLVFSSEEVLHSYLMDTRDFDDQWMMGV